MIEPNLEERALAALAGEPDIAGAMWAGDTDRLSDLAPCGCCCYEHTFEGCPARIWNGCRGSGNMTYADERAWADHYAKFHGMSEADFYGEGDESCSG